jgi:hypothetical protein
LGAGPILDLGEVADWQFELLAGEDRHRRERIAEQLARLSPTAQLFGRDPRSQGSGVLS